jgi:undecaprenyl-diphosphatase
MNVGNLLKRIKLSELVRRPETRLAAIFLVLLGLIWAFLGIAEAVGEHETRRFDRAILRLFRRGPDLAHVVGPDWVQTAAQQLTALGSGSVMLVLTLIIAGYLMLSNHFRHAFQVVAATSGGALLGWIMKLIYQRPRPEIVPRLSHVDSWSFPSGHANIAMIVYLTLGILLARYSSTGLQKIYVMAVAGVLVLVVGWTRVALGVHYPSDVLAGWTLGFSWALLVWLGSNAWETWRARRSPGDAESDDVI